MTLEGQDEEEDDDDDELGWEKLPGSSMSIFLCLSRRRCNRATQLPVTGRLLFFKYSISYLSLDTRWILSTPPRP